MSLPTNSLKLIVKTYRKHFNEQYFLRTYKKTACKVHIYIDLVKWVQLMTELFTKKTP